MSLHVQQTFSTGELDPILSERTTLAKYKAGLKTARNVIVTRAGSAVSRPGRLKLHETKIDDSPVVIFAISRQAAHLEFGVGYVRIYNNFFATLAFDVPTTYTADNLSIMQFDLSGDNVYIFVAGFPMQKLNWRTGVFVASPFATPNGPLALSVTPSGAPTGYPVDYQVTYIINGQESPGLIISNNANKIPIANGQSNIVQGTLVPIATGLTEMRTYRRPFAGGVFGYIGSTNQFSTQFPLVFSAAPASGTFQLVFTQGTTAAINWNDSAATIQAKIAAVPGLAGNIGVTGTIAANTIVLNMPGTESAPTVANDTLQTIGLVAVNITVLGFYLAAFTDLGSQADYSHSPPDLVTKVTHPTVADLRPPCGAIYQQRLVLGDFLDREAIFTSRPGFQNLFTREYPLSADSALNFKAASSGTAAVLRFCDSYGLVVFTTQGVYINAGTLSPTTLSLEKKGRWIINSKMQPLPVPGGVFFVDAATNTVRSLNWSTELGGYTAEDIGIYSGHFFRTRAVTSWGFQEGLLPVLWATFDDGTFASFTYEYEQDMRAWTRHDSPDLFVEQVAETGLPDQTLFLVRKGTKRYVEVTVPRFVPAAILQGDPQADKDDSIAAMDSLVSVRALLTASFEIMPTDPGVWDGDLVITARDNSNPFNGAAFSAVGNTLRWFSTIDKTSIDLKIVTVVDDNTRIVTPSRTFPEAEKTFTQIFQCFNIITGLDHMEGEFPGVIVDGNVVCSPLNDIENLEPVQVIGGKILLPGGILGAMVHVGRVYPCDIETLDIDTNEQKPTTIESQTINKLYIKTHESRGLYVGSKFPANNLVKGLESMDRYFLEDDDSTLIVGNRYKQPTTRRYEVMLQGDWKSNGRVAIRQADPVHFEVLSIIADAEVHWRSDR